MTKPITTSNGSIITN